MAREASDRGSRSIELEIEVAASAEAVWRALSDAEELKRWFPLDAGVEPGVGGTIWLSWGPGVEGGAPIRVWEPPARLGWAEQFPGAGPDDPPVELTVDFHIEARGGTTVVRLVHAGFGAGADWDDLYDGNAGGWSYFLRNLRYYLESRHAEPRRVVWNRTAYGATRADVWDRLLGPDGLGILPPGATPGAGERDGEARSGGAPIGVAPDTGVHSGPPRPGELREGDRFTLALMPGEGVGGTVWLFDPPYRFAGCLDLHGGAPIFVEMEGEHEGWNCGVWLSLYGDGRDYGDSLQRALDELAARVARAG